MAVIRWQMWTGARYLRLQAYGHIEGARTQLLPEHHPSLSSLLPLVIPSCLVPPGHEGLFARGLHAGLHGDFVAACHILIPQFENGLRYFIEESLGKPMVAVDASGTQMVGLLSRLLSVPELKTILGEDLIFDL